MALTRAILKFRSMAERDVWVAGRDGVDRIYETNPWVSVQLPSITIEELKKQPGIEVHPDVTMDPT